MKDENYYKQYIATIPDFPIKGIMFRDITTSLENGEVFKNIIDDFVEIVKKYDFNKIVCADARGFIFGGALAYALKKDLVLARKPGKLPRPGYTISYTLEYGINSLVIPEKSLAEGDRCLIVDDLLGTGGSCGAIAGLIKMSKAISVAAIFYIELPDLKGRDYIKKVDDFPIHSLVCFEGD